MHRRTRMRWKQAKIKIAQKKNMTT